MSAAEDLWTQGVIEQNRRWLMAYLFAATGDANLADDLVQETFRTAYEKRGEFRPDFAFGAWLRGIARNVLRREYEGATRRPALVSVEALERIEAAAAALEGRHVDPGYEERRLAALRRCVSELAGTVRSLLELQYREGLSLKQIAGRSGMQVSAVGVALFRARSALAACISRRMADAV